MQKALHGLHYDLAGAPVPETLQALLDIADPAKLLHGSGRTFTPVEACESLARKFDQTPLLPRPLHDAVMLGNARTLFKSALGDRPTSNVVRPDHIGHHTYRLAARKPTATDTP